MKLVRLFCVCCILLVNIGCTKQKKDVQGPLIDTVNIEAEDSTLNAVIESENNVNNIFEGNIKSMPTVEFLVSFRWFRGLYSGSYSDILTFNTDGTYSIFKTRGLGIYAIGNYEILNENEVLLRYPVEFPWEITSVISESLEKIFGNNDLILKLDREYIDFYNMFKLFSEKELFASEFPSPEGNEYMLDNAIVLKKKGYVKILDLTNIRREPSVNAPLAGYSFLFRFYEITPYDQDIIANFVVPDEEFRYEAIYTNINETNGYEKPWYRIVIDMEETEFAAWVYGEFVEEILNQNYNINYTEIRSKNINELINRGYHSEYLYEDNN